MSDDSDRVAELATLIDEKNARIAQLEAELDEARRLNRLAEQFVAAASEHLPCEDGGTDPPDGPEWPDWTRVGEVDAASDDASPSDGSASDATADGAAPFDLLDGGANDGLDLGASSSSDDAEPSTDVATDGSGDALTEVLSGLDSIESPDPRNDDLAALHDLIEDLEPTPLAMLEYYQQEGPATPVEAHEVVAGGDHTAAYAANRELRTFELIDHVGQGEYDTRFEDLVVDRIGGDPATIEDCRSALVEHLERVVGTRPA